jgi:CHASE3 domain sensor protein
VSKNISKPFKLAMTLVCAWIVFVIAVALVRANRSLERKSQSGVQAVANSAAALSEIESLKSVLADLDTVPREYAFTGEPDTYERCRATFAKAIAAIQKVRTSTVDNGAQQIHLTHLQPLLHGQIAAARESISAREHQSAAAAQSLINSLDVEIRHEAMQLIAAKLKSQEQRVLTANQLAAAGSIHRQQTLSAILMGGLGLSTLAAFFFQRRLANVTTAELAITDLPIDQLLESYPRRVSTPLEPEPASTAPAKNLQKDFDAA